MLRSEINFLLLGEVRPTAEKAYAASIAIDREVASWYSLILPKERLHLPNIENAAGGGQEAQETLAVGFADDPGV